MTLFFFFLVGTIPALLLLLVPSGGIAFLCGYGIFAVDVLLIWILGKKMLEGAAGRLPDGGGGRPAVAWFFLALLKSGGLIFALYLALVVWQFPPLPLFGGALYSLIVTGLHGFAQVRKGSGAH